MTKPTPVPSGGGSYIRLADGTLQPNLDDAETAARVEAEAASAAPAPEAAAKPAPKSKLKEA